MKDQFGRRIMKKFIGLRAKTYGYLIDDDSYNKKARDTKKCVINKDLNMKIMKIVQKQLNL